MEETTFDSPHQDIQTRLRSLEKYAVQAGVSPAQYFLEIEKDLKSVPDPHRAVTNFLRFLETGLSGIHLRDLFLQRSLQRQALLLFSQSQYLADIIVRNPELFGWLMIGDHLKISCGSREMLKEAIHLVTLFERIEKKLDALKRFQRREMLRIGAREILGESDIIQSTSELSLLAEAIIKAVLEAAIHEFQNRIGSRFEHTLAIIGLGKLGGSELNFSSDIDLMFVYDADGDFDVPTERISSFHEYYSRMASWVVQRLTEMTGEGYLYRVDTRLRPDGKSGALTLSCAGYLHYYETRGKLWERQMLTKARVIAGNEEVGMRFLSDLRPFVYPRTHLSDPLHEILTIKQKIESKIFETENIKLGRGGIRDIEFVVQAYQLLYAGNQPELKEHNTLGAIQKLDGAQFISSSDAQTLRDAYLFLRRVEHRLQLLYGYQTHTLPQTEYETNILAKRLGFESSSTFMDELSSHKQAVRKIFDSLFIGMEAEGKISVTDDERISEEIRKRIGLNLADDQSRMEDAREILRELPVLKKQEHLERFIILMQKYSAPQWGLRNFRLLCSVSEIKRSLIAAVENSSYLDLLLLICSRSRNMTLNLAQEPLLFETLTSQPNEIFKEELSWLYLLPHDAYRYRVYNEFKIALTFLVGEIGVEKFIKRLSSLADNIVQSTFEAVARTAEFKMPPMCFIALGKLGSMEMNIASDIDGFGVVSSRADARSSQNAEKVVRELIERLEQKSVYRVDVRLRPEGASAPLVCNEEYLLNYLEKRASLWERQAFTKARLVWGDRSLWNQTEKILTQFVFQTPLANGWSEELLAMRKKIEEHREKGMGDQFDLKTCAGGLMDLEFLLQAIQLKCGKSIRTALGQNSVEFIRDLERLSFFGDVDLGMLQKNLRFMRMLEAYIKMNSEKSAFVLPTSPATREAIAKGMGMNSVEELLRTIEKVRFQNRELFLKTVGIIQQF